MQIPLCPHAVPAWHYCPKCPQAIIQQPLQVEYPEFEREHPKPEDEQRSTVIVFEF